MSESNESNALQALDVFWKQCKDPIWLATNVKLIRNLSKFFFPGKLSVETRRQVRGLLKTGLTSSPLLDKPQFIYAEKLTPAQKEYLFEHFLCTEGFHQAQQGDAFVIDNSSAFLGVVNVQDHLQLQLLDCKGEIEAAWNKLLKMEIELGKELTFAFNDRFGFLTADPSHCGTGLLLHLFVQLPALIHTGRLQEILSRKHLEGVGMMGLQGEPDRLIGDIVVLYNTSTLGLTEEDIVTQARSILTILYMEEKSALNTLRSQPSQAIKDAVSRAYGLLKYSYQIETTEALNALSLLKLGLSLEWVGDTSLERLNSLLFACRRGHLQLKAKTELDQKELLHHRSALLQEGLKELTLHV